MGLQVPSGATIHVVAPSGPVNRERYTKGAARVRRALPGHTWVESDNLWAQTGYLAGADADRSGGIRRALADANAGAIWCARGGYGATRLLPTLDPEAYRARPLPFVGFSDITALLCWAWVVAETVGIHGPVLTQLSTVVDEDLEATADLLRGDIPSPLAAGEASIAVHGGRVEGTLIAANLEILRSLIGTPWMPSLDGCILALEEVGERPYRLDRMLTHLRSSGVLRGVRAIAIGQLTGCEEPPNRDEGVPPAVEVVTDVLRPLGVPILTGLPFGHASDRNAPLPFGASARLDVDAGVLEVLGLDG